MLSKLRLSRVILAPLSACRRGAGGEVLDYDRPGVAPNRATVRVGEGKARDGALFPEHLGNPIIFSGYFYKRYK